jgi:DMSO/TMAO reductase YedYZ molybdopterin-dependent catalytic subunit
MSSTRRGLIFGGAGLGALALSGCDQLSHSKGVQRVIRVGEAANKAAQRSLLLGRPLAPEFKAKDLSPVFKLNGSVDGFGDDYHRMVDTGFADFRLRIDGLVRSPLSLSLAEIRQLPARSQITRHDCVEGWSAIGGWTGAPLGPLLKAAGLLPQARFVVFHCADRLGSANDSDQYYESIDLVDAFHPQTILAYALNGQTLPVGHGAPLRLRVERQLGYKQAKFVMRVEAVDSLARFGKGRGGYWPDRGYEWYAGI